MSAATAAIRIERVSDADRRVHHAIHCRTCRPELADARTRAAELRKTFLSRYVGVLGDQYAPHVTIPLTRAETFALRSVATQCGHRGVVDATFLDEDLDALCRRLDCVLADAALSPPPPPPPWFVRFDMMSAKSGCGTMPPLWTARDIVRQLASSPRTVAAADDALDAAVDELPPLCKLPDDDFTLSARLECLRLLLARQCAARLEMGEHEAADDCNVVAAIAVADVDVQRLSSFLDAFDQLPGDDKDEHHAFFHECMASDAYGLVQLVQRADDVLRAKMQHAATGPAATAPASSSSSPLLLNVCAWRQNMSQDTELRVFVRRRRVVALCAYAGAVMRTRYAADLTDAQLADVAAQCVALLGSGRNGDGLLCRLCDAAGKSDDVVVDVDVDWSGGMPRVRRVIELNPFGCWSPTGPTLFDWHADAAILNGEAAEIVFRV